MKTGDLSRSKGLEAKRGSSPRGPPGDTFDIAEDLLPRLFLRRQTVAASLANCPWKSDNVHVALVSSLVSYRGNSSYTKGRVGGHAPRCQATVRNHSQQAPQLSRAVDSWHSHCMTHSK